jgi:hypothetical protein
LRRLDDAHSKNFSKYKNSANIFQLGSLPGVWNALELKYASDEARKHRALPDDDLFVAQFILSHHCALPHVLVCDGEKSFGSRFSSQLPFGFVS